MTSRNEWSHDAVRERVRAYILEAYLSPDTALGDDEDLLHVLNSLQLLRMVMELEQTFGVTIGNADMTPENLGTIDRIATFIVDRRGS